MSKYQFRNQLKAQGNRLNQKYVNKWLLVPKKEVFLSHLHSKLLVKFNMRVFFKYSKINMRQWMYFETLTVPQELTVHFDICVYLEKLSVTS